MEEPITYAVDLAKDVFQVAWVPSQGQPVQERRLSRAGFEAFLTTARRGRMVMEACGSSHHWARTAAEAGFAPRLLAPAAVKAFANPKIKTDRRDALAILAADSRADLKGVAVKSRTQQARHALLSAREDITRERVRLRNKIRAQLAEQGVFAARGAAGFAGLQALVEAKGSPEGAKSSGGAESSGSLPVELVCAIKSQLALLEVLDKQRGELDGRIRELARTDPLALNLMAMPGVGPHTALMLVARVAEPSRFKDGRAFVSWLGLAPGESSSGTRRTQTGVTCRGDRALRAALVRGATSVLRHARAGTQRPASRDPWLDGLIKRRGDMAPKQMAVALAGRMARQLRAMMVTGECWLDATGRSELRTRRNLAWQAARAAGKAGTGTAAVIAGSIPEQEATAAAPA